MFDKKIPFFKVMQRVEARKWQPHKETFDQYVLHKLSLIHGLDLPPRDVIHVLIGGIVSAPVRAAALSLTSETVKDFVDRMRNIAEGCMEADRKPGGSNKSKPKVCRNCGSVGHSHQECRKELKCFFCKKSGHRQYDCPVKKKNRSPSVQQRTTTTPAAVSEDSSQAEQIAFVADVTEDRLELCESSVQVDSLQGQPCKLVALLDTGSAVSFIKYSVYLSFSKFITSELRPTVKKFVNIKDMPLEIIGTVVVKFTLSLVNHRDFEMSLFVIKDQAFPHDFILGRDFLSTQRLTVVFRFREYSGEENNNNLSLFAELPLFVDENSCSKLEGHLENAEIDFDAEAKQRLVRTITEVERSAVDPVDDGYTVSVRLKDESVYAFAPRRFAYSERIELRKITDDLLERGIIKPSVSPYCARVVPIRKRTAV